MRKNKLMLALAVSAATLLAGCQNMDVNKLASSGMTAFKAATLSDADAKALADGACQEMDSQNTVASASSSYGKRLAKIANALGNNVDGTSVNYKVYMTNDVNAWAMANGCVRVYSGLMDLMTDNEIEAVLGHELGHVALGHSRKAMQTAYATVAARDAISSAGGAAAALSKSQLGDVAEGIVNSAFSRSQESDADNFSYDLLKKRNINTQGLVTSFEKLAKLSSGHEKSLFDSHPPSEERAQNIRDRIAADK
ncbi:M48 family metallopeptidase [Entomohabitans teleogrylli]|uniref:metalloprotease LoiP n=1 Tax=Entomohabitans teleogrylli TaxID=1384589 RepID=UPI00073D4AAD|nr:M48 family metallopeptidase [Entomohabitans teleogrylli]